ncbi:CinA family protein [Allopusillimonas soli]|uniref:CinA family protein n=1 Tax=Allopusillimonas soli TaxID=659016 RepID=A0A853FM29_9BURK|nr:CinA family protein [Allopusillimonas soli]NYT38956.1 CinA family protein [Allopusillimonas soli]TEA70051.1 CinA family protein [Allopusillimonas soli]
MNEMDSIARYLQEHHLLLVTAESCTAGLIAARLVDYPQAGEILDCAFVTYSPIAKQKCLGVSEETIRSHGLTSEEVSIEMAKGALAKSRASVAIANTGVTEFMPGGPPAGTQCFAWMFGRDTESARIYSETRRFIGGRNEIRSASADYALLQLMRLHTQWQQKKII